MTPRTKQSLELEMFIQQATIAIYTPLKVAFDNLGTDPSSPEDMAARATQLGRESMKTMVSTLSREQLEEVVVGVIGSKIRSNINPILLVLKLQGHSNPGATIINRSEARVRELEQQIAAMV